MTTAENSSRKSDALIEHLARFPEDLRDIRRLQRRYGMTAEEVALALEGWHRVWEGLEPTPRLAH
jgi:hypothetical protein